MKSAPEIYDFGERFQQVIANSKKGKLKSISGPGDIWPIMREEAEAKAQSEPQVIFGQ